MIILDTNIISELQRPVPDASVVRWLSAIDIRSTFICGPVLMEQAYGAERHRLKSGSVRYVESLQRLRSEYSRRAPTLDLVAWELAGRLRGRRDSKGRPLSVGDAMIAAICLAHDATLATRNVPDFEGLDLKLVNPFEASA